MSPDLFNLYSEMILREIENIDGLRAGGQNINNQRYADDTVLIAETEQDLQDLLDTVVVASGKKRTISKYLENGEYDYIIKKTKRPNLPVRK